MRSTSVALATIVSAILSACAVEPDEDAASSEIATGERRDVPDDRQTVQRSMAIESDALDGFGTNLTHPAVIRWTYINWIVDVEWGFDYSPANNHLRAYALMIGNQSNIHLQAEPLNLGDRNGVLESLIANTQTGRLAIETAAVDCHRPNGVYLSNLHYSIRWPDGVLTSNQQTGRFEGPASLICQ